MNRYLGASSSVLRQQASASLQPAALFHSTAVLDRRRNSRHRFNGYTLRFTRKEAKRTLLRDASLYLEHVLHGFRNSRHDDSHNSSAGYTSWFEKQYFSKGRKKNQFCNWESQWRNHVNRRKRPAHFFGSDTDGKEYEAIFGGSSQEEQGFHRSFHSSDSYNDSTKYGQRHSSWDWKHESDNEDNKSMSDLVSERLILGLAASGPLKLKDIKSAYHACALRWHPDRHQGSSKVAAAEKFKHCTEAYKTLCDRLAAA